jgi:3-oxoacyl-[acyl-carrier protein] reductase
VDLKLSGKRALVTGSTAGLGEAIAKLLAAEGVTVVVHGRDQKRANAVAKGITTAGGRTEVTLGDLATDAGADVVAAKAQEGGAIDILVNNAGNYHHLNWATALPDKWLDTYQVNVLSAVRMIQRLVPSMRKCGWGRVIQIGGGLAGQPVPMQPDYNASLAARHNLAVSLARDLKDSGVTSNIVAPGAILVPAVKELLEKIAPQQGWGTTWEEIERGCVRDMVPTPTWQARTPIT